jgi:hypothetical protein
MRSKSGKVVRSRYLLLDHIALTCILIVSQGEIIGPHEYRTYPATPWPPVIEHGLMHSSSFSGSKTRRYMIFRILVGKRRKSNILDIIDELASWPLKTLLLLKALLP